MIRNRQNNLYTVITSYDSYRGVMVHKEKLEISLNIQIGEWWKLWLIHKMLSYAVIKIMLKKILFTWDTLTKEYSEIKAAQIIAETTH